MTKQENGTARVQTRAISIRGARVNNLHNIDVDIPRNAITVITGLSGSGKSSLAFDTLYAEGQRRFVESLSAYARQFLDRMNKPDVDAVVIGGNWSAYFLESTPTLKEYNYYYLDNENERHMFEGGAAYRWQCMNWNHS